MESVWIITGWVLITWTPSSGELTPPRSTGLQDSVYHNNSYTSTPTTPSLHSSKGVNMVVWLTWGVQAEDGAPASPQLPSLRGDSSCPGCQQNSSFSSTISSAPLSSCLLPHAVTPMKWFTTSPPVQSLPGSFPPSRLVAVSADGSGSISSSRARLSGWPDSTENEKHMICVDILIDTLDWRVVRHQEHYNVAPMYTLLGFNHLRWYVCIMWEGVATRINV